VPVAAYVRIGEVTLGLPAESASGRDA
jgi:hypothetical protein